MAEQESPAALLSKMRWAKTTKAQRTEHARMMAQARHDSKTPEERSEIARRAYATRRKNLAGPPKPRKKKK